MQASELAATLAIQFRYTSRVFRMNLEGIDAEAFRRAPAGGGNSLAWVAGHVLHARTGLLFHEAYHVGQLGVLRRAAGRPGAIA